MGGNTTNTTTQTSGLSNPQMNKAASTIGTMLNDQLKGGVKPYTESLVPELSGQTQAGISGLTNNPNSSIFSQGISDTLQGQADIASGNVQNDALRQRALDDALKASNSVFTASGRFGSGSHAENLSEGATNALAGLDYARQQQAIQNLPGLYQASMLPASAQLQAGQLMDSYNTARAQDAERIFDAKENAGWNTLQRGGSIFSGTAPISGTTGTTTQTQQVPWWQTGLGIGAGLLSFM